MGDQGRPIAIDLFSGAGGLSLGFERAGFDVLAAVEYDPVHAAVHRYNFPLTELLCADVRIVSADDVIAAAHRGWELHHPEGPRWNGRIDAVIGGPSCQGFSVIGNMSHDDERNDLVVHFARLVTELQPETFCMENVPGLLHPKYEALRANVLGRLEGAGYRIAGADRVVRAEDFGVPQRRHRVIMIGTKAPVNAPFLAPTTIEETTVGDAFAGLEGIADAPVSPLGELRLTTEQLETLDAVENEYSRLAGLREERPGAYGHPRRVDRSVLSGLGLTRHSESSIRRFDETPPGTKEKVSRYFRLALDRASLTLRAGTGRERGSFSAPRPIHPIEPRVITVREAARLHSFPDWFRFHVTNWHAHRQIGNSVPPLLAEAAGAAVMTALGRVPKVSDREPVALGPEALLSLSVSRATTVLGASADHVPAARVRRAASPGPLSTDVPIADEMGLAKPLDDRRLHLRRSPR
ncbi:DNA cytosine methyltransferase [Amnibacterium endophyticum]|uniref:DNA (cytosine-5-)-methyltransferase n=1 Tax=Amnibacterium endophyticum TaxID=2109337 RepID=A0ABW4LBK9_9MICO